MRLRFSPAFAVGFAILLTGFSFTERWMRYPRPDEILMIFQDRFPDGFIHPAMEMNSCRQLTTDNRSFLGDNRPADGKPIVAEPNLHFAKWYASCLADAVGNEVAFLIRRQSQAQAGSVDSKVLEWLPAPTEPSLREEMRDLIHKAGTQQKPANPAVSISPELRIYIVTQVVARLIGPDPVLNGKGPLFSAQQLRQQVLASVDALDFSEAGFQSMGFKTRLQHSESSIFGYLAATMLVVGLQDEFLMQ